MLFQRLRVVKRMSSQEKAMISAKRLWVPTGRESMTLKWAQEAVPVRNLRDLNVLCTRIYRLTHDDPKLATMHTLSVVAKAHLRTGLARMRKENNRETICELARSVLCFKKECRAFKLKRQESDWLKPGQDSILRSKAGRSCCNKSLVSWEKRKITSDMTKYLQLQPQALFCRTLLVILPNQRILKQAGREVSP